MTASGAQDAAHIGGERRLMEDEAARYKRLVRVALKHGWAIVPAALKSKRSTGGYRMVNSKGAKGPGNGPDGPVSLDEVEAFLKMNGEFPLAPVPA
jgi:hypothetical protein